MLIGLTMLHPRAISNALNKLEEDEGQELPLGPITPKKFDYRVRLMLFFGVGFILGVAALFVFLDREFDSTTSLRSSALSKPQAPSAEIKEILKEGGKERVYEERNNFVKNERPLVGGNVPTPAPFGFSWERNKKPTKAKDSKGTLDPKNLPPEIMYGGDATNP